MVPSLKYMFMKFPKWLEHSWSRPTPKGKFHSPEVLFWVDAAHVWWVIPVATWLHISAVFWCEKKLLRKYYQPCVFCTKNAYFAAKFLIIFKLDHQQFYHLSPLCLRTQSLNPQTLVLIRDLVVLIVCATQRCLAQVILVGIELSSTYKMFPVFFWFLSPRSECWFTDCFSINRLKTLLIQCPLSVWQYWWHNYTKEWLCSCS